MMLAMRRALVWMVLAGGTAAIGGCTTGAFACVSDEQCQSGAAAGLCQSNGYCSFPDDECPSGQRFGDAAPDAVANACVDLDAGTDTTTSVSGSVGGTRPDPSQGLESTTVGPTDDSTTVALDDGTGTDPALTTGPETSASTGSTTPGCDNLVEDDFEAGMLDPMWEPTVPSGGAADVQGGQLVLSLPFSMVPREALVTTALGPMEGGWASVQITELGMDLTGHGGLILGNGACELAIYITDTTVEASVVDLEGMVRSTVGAEDLPGVPLWLQIQFEGNGDIRFQTSSDGMMWNSLADGSYPCADPSLSYVAELAAWDETPSTGGARMFERFEACVP